jgi:hypothetical protein
VRAHCWASTLARGVIIQELMPTQLWLRPRMQSCDQYGRTLLVSGVISKSRRSAQRRFRCDERTSSEPVGTLQKVCRHSVSSIFGRLETCRPGETMSLLEEDWKSPVLCQSEPIDPIRKSVARPATSSRNSGARRRTSLRRLSGWSAGAVLRCFIAARYWQRQARLIDREAT